MTGADNDTRHARPIDRHTVPNGFLTAPAVETLEESLLDGDKYPSVRLGAARALVETGIHQHDAEHILRKLDEIETYQRQ